MPIGRPRHELIKALADSGMSTSHAYALAEELTEFANEQALAVEVPFTAEVPLDVRETLMAQHFVSDAIEFTAGAVRLTGAKTFVRVAAGDFTLSVGEVESVDVTDDVVTLTVDAPYADDDVVTVTYTPGANPLRDLFGNQAAALDAEAVTNNVEP